MFFEDTIAEVGKFMDSGGPVLWAIVVLLFVMWTRIFERLWYLRSSVTDDVQAAIDTWEARKERKSKHAHQVREKIISEVSLEINTNMMMIKTLIALAPLFGLLGTVTGMITAFDVMAFTGGGDVKAMAGGVSQATVPTMSGMVAALSGVFAMTYVDRMAIREQQLLEDHLTMDH